MRNRRPAPAAPSAAAVIILLAVSVAAARPSFAQDSRQKPAEKKLDKAQTQEIQALVKLVTEVSYGQPAPSDFPVVWQNHYLKARDQRTFVPYIISIPQGSIANPSVSMYVRVVKKGNEPVLVPRVWADPGANLYYKPGDERFGTAGQGSFMSEADALKAGYTAASGPKDPKAAARQEFAFEDVSFPELKAPEGKGPYRLARALSVLPGDYTIYVVVRERPATEKKNAAAPKTGLVKQSITVPDYWLPGLTMSSIIVADKVDPLTTPVPESQLADNPYAFGTTRLTPAVADRTFTKKDELAVIFLVYNTAETNKKPDVAVEYGFYQRTEGSEKFFNKTNPQMFNAETLPPQFDLAAGHQLVAGQSIPLALFPEGDYRLEIKITDKVAGKSIVQSVNFTVTSQ